MNELLALTNLVIDAQQGVEEYLKRIKIFLKDKSLPLDDRWNAYF